MKTTIDPKEFFLVASALVSLAFFSGCSGPRAFTKGEYDDPTRVELLDDKFNESDMQQMAKTVIGALSQCSYVKKAAQPPVAVIETVVNKTQEHIDTVALTDQIKKALIQNGEIRFIHKESRGLLDAEYQYNKAGGAVDPKTAKKPGKQAGANYVMNGRIMTNIQEVGRDKFIYYQLTIDLINTETSTIDCTENAQIRKKYEKKRISL